MPLSLSGTVVGALLNDPAEIAALGGAAFQPPHKAPPVAPVLEVKPRHTLAGDGAVVLLPAGEDRLEVGVSLGIVMGQGAIAGYLVAADFSLPVSAHYRPSVRLKARDGFCPISAPVPAAAVADADALAWSLHVDGRLVARGGTGARVRNVAQLLAAVGEFMTLAPGDVLLLGRGHALASVGAGQAVVAGIEGVGTLHCSVAAEGPA